MPTIFSGKVRNNITPLLSEKDKGNKFFMNKSAHTNETVTIDLYLRAFWKDQLKALKMTRDKLLEERIDFTITLRTIRNVI